ncbi:hypothetical protein SEA_NICEHOUSE_245 [Rhodococcus phage NiceHouse]|nr:hypothetical protein SEA_NICEHOUSE_245 [Rhodococcus phage NiceHouse]
MKLWIDDIREAPNDWLWCKTSTEAIWFLELWKQFQIEFDVVAFDHDLGGDDTTRVCVLWIIENEFFPKEVQMLTANPVGYEWIQGMVNRYFPDETVVPW